MAVGVSIAFLLVEGVVVPVLLVAMRVGVGARLGLDAGIAPILAMAFGIAIIQQSSKAIVTVLVPVSVGGLMFAQVAIGIIAAPLFATAGAAADSGLSLGIVVVVFGMAERIGDPGEVAAGIVAIVPNGAEGVGVADRLSGGIAGDLFGASIRVIYLDWFAPFVVFGLGGTA